MRTSLIEIEQIEKWLYSQDDPQDRLLFEARLQLEPELAGNVKDQQLACELIRRMGRNRFRNEIKSVENRLLTNNRYRSFQERISSIFKF
ncbi:MAG: hypothetical protein AAGC88_07905 [Bacteroidota bacterium]